MRNRATKKRCNILTGFTFIELLIVIAIIGVLSTLAIPRIKKTIDNFEFENFVKDIYYLDKFLQASAITQGKVNYLNIDSGERKFWATLQNDTEIERVPGRFGRDYRAPQGINITSNTTGIYFYPDGSISQSETSFTRYDRKLSIITRGAIGQIQIK